MPLPKTIQAGLLIIPGYQWLDAAGAVDYLNFHSAGTLKLFKQPPALVEKAHNMVWHYIAENLNPVPASSGPDGVPTCTFADCPPLDILVVPGSDWAVELPDAYYACVRRIIEHERFVALLSVCTGSIVLARGGIIDGRRVCSDKLVLRELALAGKLPTNVTWLGDRRWNVDGNVWSSAGVTAGIDVVAEFARLHFDPEIREYVKDAAEYEPKPDKPDTFARILDGVKL